MDKLSDYMRIGATRRPQAFGSYFDENNNSCALGTADYFFGPNFEDIFPFIFEENLASVCPECQEATVDLFHYIAHLNDGHKWTREAIADNLEGLGL